MFYRIVGIDPSTTNIGVAILDIDLSKMSVINISTTNIDVNNISKLKHGEVVLMSRLKIMEDTVNFINSLYPNLIAIEKPFINVKRPTAVIPLANSMGLLYNGLIKQPILVEPLTVKGVMGVLKGISKDTDTKLLVRDKLKKIYPKLEYDKMSEHEVDALSVAHSVFINLTLGDMICSL